MIITVSGAGCTGKTTLIEALKKETTKLKLKNVKYYGEFIRDIFEERYSIKYKSFEDLLTSGSIDDIITIHMKVMRIFTSVIERSSPDDILIFDRSPYDILLYLYLNTCDMITTKGYELDTYREAVNTMQSYLVYFNSKSDKILYYVRPFQEEVEEDGFRPLSLINRREREIALFDNKFLSNPSVELLPDNLEDRLSVIMSKIKEFNVTV